MLRFEDIYSLPEIELNEILHNESIKPSSFLNDRFYATLILKNKLNKIDKIYSEKPAFSELFLNEELLVQETPMLSLVSRFDRLRKILDDRGKIISSFEKVEQNENISTSDEEEWSISDSDYESEEEWSLSDSDDYEIEESTNYCRTTRSKTKKLNTRNDNIINFSIKLFTNFTFVAGQNKIIIEQGGSKITKKNNPKLYNTLTKEITSNKLKLYYDNEFNLSNNIKLQYNEDYYMVEYPPGMTLFEIVKSIRDYYKEPISPRDQKKYGYTCFKKSNYLNGDIYFLGLSEYKDGYVPMFGSWI